MSLAVLTAAVRRLVRAEVARFVAPNSARACNAYAVAWIDAVRARGGDSRGLARVSGTTALRRLQRLSVGLTLAAAQNDNGIRFHSADHAVPTAVGMCR